MPSLRGRLSNGIEIGTLVVLILTLFAVVWYAWEARQANILTNRAIATNSRPYIKITLDEESFASAQSLAILQPNFFVENIGRLPAVVTIEGNTDWSNARHPRRPFSYKSIDKRFIFPNEPHQQFPLEAAGMTPGESQDLQEGGGQYLIYISASYDGYVVRLCNVYEISFSGKNYNLFKPTLCPEPSSNYAN